MNYHGMIEILRQIADTEGAPFFSSRAAVAAVEYIKELELCLEAEAIDEARKAVGLRE